MLSEERRPGKILGREGLVRMQFANGLLANC